MARPHSIPCLAPCTLALFAILLGCERKPKTATGFAPAPTTAAAGATTSEGALTPVLVLDGAMITAHTEDHRVQVQAEPGWTYEWTVTGGQITSGWSASEVRFNVEGPGQLRLTCKVRDAAGREGVATGTQTIIEAPILGSFEAQPPAVTQGGTTFLRWEAKDVASLRLDPGGQDVLRIGGQLVTPTETTTYTLTAGNLAKTEVQKTLTVKVVPPPIIRGFAAEGSSKVGQPMTLKAEFAEGRAEIRFAGAAIASGTDSPLRVQVNPASGSVYELVVTNEAGATATQAVTVTAPPPK